MPYGICVRRIGAITLCVASTALVAACGSSGGSSPGSLSSSAAAGGSSSTGTTSMKLPSSCAQIRSTVGAITGDTAIVKTLKAKSNGVNCEFGTSSATSIVIVNIGPATPAAFATLRAKSGAGGRTTTSVSGLEATAFSVANKGRISGLAALTSQNIVFAVIAVIPLAKDKALIEQLMKHF